jgi:hypothetical protein
MLHFYPCHVDYMYMWGSSKMLNTMVITMCTSLATLFKYISLRFGNLCNQFVMVVLMECKTTLKR